MRNNTNNECLALLEMIESNHPEWNAAQVSEELVKIVEAMSDKPLTLVERAQGLLVDFLMGVK